MRAQSGTVDVAQQAFEVGLTSNVAAPTAGATVTLAGDDESKRFPHGLPDQHLWRF
jgi:hypothetical protein